MVDLLNGPWPWYVAGPLIALIMFGLMYSGKSFGVSSTFRTLCAASGAGRRLNFFRYNWKGEYWNLVFVGGAVFGGLIASTILSNPDPMNLNPQTVQELEGMGLQEVGSTYLPAELFSFEYLLSWQGLIFLVGGGLLVGFGARWAGGCTSGHAISGMSNLQIPSVIALIGFFIGGLIMSWLILPMLLTA